MERTYIKDLKEKLGEHVKVNAHVEKIIKVKSVAFIIIRDISGRVQVVVDKDKFEQEIKDLRVGSSLSVVGEVTKSEKQLEIAAHELKAVSTFTDKLPIDMLGKTNTSFEKQLDWRYLQLRDEKHAFVFKIQTLLEHSFREFFIKNDFIEIHTPKIVGSASESGAEVFSIDYFGRVGYLAQSPQFYKQMAMSAGFDKVFEIAPAFRADRAKTAVHATEFTSIDVELSWIEDHLEVMKLEEELIRYGLSKVKEIYGEEIKRIFDKEIVMPDSPIPIIALDEAIKIVIEMGHSDYHSLDGDLDNEAQKLICEYTLKEYGSEFTFIDKYPFASRAFYTMKCEDDPRLSKGFDLIWRGVEITSGAKREHRYDKIKEQALEKGLKDIDFYLDFFKYGSVPHGGFAIGLARFLMIMLDLSSIKETTFIHRSINKIKP